MMILAACIYIYKHLHLEIYRAGRAIHEMLNLISNDVIYCCMEKIERHCNDAIVYLKKGIMRVVTLPHPLVQFHLNVVIDQRKKIFFLTSYPKKIR